MTATDKNTARPNLADYDFIFISTSAGKDSQAMMDVVVEAAKADGVLDRVIAVHADLGSVEWEGTGALAAEHAAHYGIPFEVVRKDQHDGDLFTAIEARADKLIADGKLDKNGNPARAWPMTGMCYGTSDFKTAQIAKLATKLAKQIKKTEGRAARILDCVGLAKDESPARRKKLDSYEAEHGYAYRIIKDNRNQYFAKWYPVANYSVTQIWDRIKAAGTRHHFAYDLGMSRLSCAFCVCASNKDLRISAAHNTDLAKKHIALEEKAGSFKANKTLAEIVGDVVAEQDAKVHLPIAA
jgi:3'-phosphoadenosine 5'-phosphosulfate sulfotransferase (PAPS reductase)/FAD synthetase